MKVFIMRGLPGSGKSTWIKNNFPFEGKVEVFSADDFHMFDGVYKYDPKRAGYAHDQCLLAYLTCIRVEKVTPFVVVDNTNTTLMELAPYVRLAEIFGIDYEIIYIPCDPITAIMRNIHSVPENTILQMHKNLQTEIVPTYWNQRIIY